MLAEFWDDLWTGSMRSGGIFWLGAVNDESERIEEFLVMGP